MYLFKVILISVLALLLQLKLGRVGAGLENAVLLALIGLAFVLSWSELCMLIAVAIWILNFQPWFSTELLLLVIIPLAVRLTREFLPAVPFVSFLLAAGIGVGIWYFFADVHFIIQFPQLFLWEIFTGVVWAALLFGILRSFSLFRS